MGLGEGGAWTNAVGRKFSGIGPARWLCVWTFQPQLGADALILQAWGRAFECARVLAPG